MDISLSLIPSEPGETDCRRKTNARERIYYKEKRAIKVCFLLKAPCSKDGFLKNRKLLIIQTIQLPILVILSCCYRESNNSWIL